MKTIVISTKSDPRNVELFNNSTVPSDYTLALKDGNKRSLVKPPKPIIPRKP